MTKEAEYKSEIKGLDDFKLTTSKVKELEFVFLPYFKKATPLYARCTKLINEAKEGGVTEELIEKAATLRKEIGQVRIDSDKKRAGEKKEYLQTGKAIDFVGRSIKEKATEKEALLKKEIEEHFINIEKKRLEELKKVRRAALAEFVEEDALFGYVLESMEQDVFDALLKTKKEAFEAQKAAEKKVAETIEKAEKDRKAEEVRLQKENAKLKKSVARAVVTKKELRAEVKTVKVGKAEISEKDALAKVAQMFDETFAQNKEFLHEIGHFDFLARELISRREGLAGLKLDDSGMVVNA